MTDQDLKTLDEQWRSKWPACQPVAESLKYDCKDHWVRFHALPESKRYPDTREELGEILSRHRQLLSELGLSAPFYVLTADWSKAPDGEPEPDDSERSRLEPKALRWKVYLEDDSNPEFTIYRRVYASRHESGIDTLDELLTVVADDKLEEVIIAPTDLRWLYHPYDGGMDVVLSTAAERDALKQKHETWLSQHPNGL